MTADHLHDQILHIGVQKNMPLLMAVGVHSEQIVQIVKEMEMNAQLTGNLQGISCSTAFDNAVRLFV